MAAKYAKVKGLKELIQKFNYLGEISTLERISYRATFGAAKDIREAARANAEGTTQQHTGALLRGFALKRIVIGSRRGYTVGVRHGPKMFRSKKHPTDDPYYWFFLELGTVHIAKPGFGFFRRAFAAAQSKAPQQIIAAGRKAVLDSGNRALKQFGNGGAK